MGRYTNRFDAKRDANEPEIVQAFKLQGISVHRLDKPLDLLLGYKKRNYLVEVKVPGKHLNDNQLEFTSLWQGQWVVINSVEQANKFANEILKG